MKTAGRALLAVVAVVALIMCGRLVLHWKEVSTWLRLRGVGEIAIRDEALGEHVLNSSGVVAGALRETRRFISSLAPTPRADFKIVGYSSEIVFASGVDPVASLRLCYSSLNGMQQVIDFCGATYVCGYDAWYRYLERVFLPLRPSLQAGWMSGERGDLDAAGLLLMVAPETVGVVDFVCQVATPGGKTTKESGDDFMRALRLLFRFVDNDPRIAQWMEGLLALPEAPLWLRSTAAEFLRRRREGAPVRE